ncbi:MAG: glycoside hydrolase family 125 protein [Ruthenibacterium sp.]
MAANYIPSGNEMLSLPTINEKTAAIEDLTFLSMQYKGLLDVRGCTTQALITPYIEIAGVCQPLSALQWQRLSYWVPQFSGSAGPLGVTGCILTPIAERGFVYSLSLTNPTDMPLSVQYGLCGTWAGAVHCVNEEKELSGEKHCFTSAWNDSIVFDMRAGAPMFSFAPMADAPLTTKFHQDGAGIHYTLMRTDTIESGQTVKLSIYWGIGYEEVAATTSAKEILRHGFDWELAKTLAWLDARVHHFENQRLCEMYNTNLFFCMFFSTGITFDTEEFIIATSRSPRYYVSAAYWDRDSLLWAFPAILDADAALARQMLTYVFGRQRRNIGVHSRFIDGTVLEPGFELDELMAPILALQAYAVKTGDLAFLEESDVKKGVAEILAKLQTHRHPDFALYDTFLQPTDDEIVYPYLTYDNVLVWKALHAIAQLYPNFASIREEAEKVKKAIYTMCVHEKDGKQFFAWSIDGNGHYDIYDEPPGSLQLLPYLDFCTADDDIYCNTVEMIRSPAYAYSFANSPIAEIGCPHAPHPWILSVANSLLCGRVEHCTHILLNIQMDNGIACESVDENSGICTTGEAFATCAGFLCHAMRTAISEAKKRAK